MADREDLICNVERDEYDLPVFDFSHRSELGQYDSRYEDWFPEVAKMILSEAPMRTKAHLCSAFQCSKPCLVRWYRKHPLFLEAVQEGLAIGEAKFREKLSDHAFKPSQNVNNGLIKLLAANVYGMKEEQQVINVHTEVHNNPEEELTKRGIPIPETPIEDMDAVGDDWEEVVNDNES